MGRSAACITLAVLTLVGVVMIATVTALFSDFRRPCGCKGARICP